MRARSQASRSGRAAAALALLAALAVAVAGCGGGDEALSESDYRAQLDDACDQTLKVLLALPQRQAEEGFSSDRASEIAEQASADFLATAKALQPPSSLEEADGELIEELGVEPPQSTDPKDFLPHFQRLEQIYTELGAERCAANQKQSIAALRAAPGS